MLIRSKIDPDIKEKEILVLSDREDGELKNIMDSLHMMFDLTVTGTDRKGDHVNVRLTDVISFASWEGKVKVLSVSGEMMLTRTLASLEDELPKELFFRISRSEIINIKRIRKLDMSFSGTIKVIMNTGYETYTSRRNVAGLKDLITGKEKK